MGDLARRLEKLEGHVDTSRRCVIIIGGEAPDKPNFVVEMPPGFLSDEERERYRWEGKTRPAPQAGALPAV